MEALNHYQARTLAITSIDTPRREAFYWGAILTTFALGTAAGDLATEELNLGFRNGVLIFGGLIAATWVAYRLGAGQVLTFWIAYVLTRPLGASLGDLLTQDKDFGGLGLGASVTSLLFFGTIVVLVTREQVLATRHGVAVKGAGPLGGYRQDYLWAVVAVAMAGWGLRPAADTTPTAEPAPMTTAQAGAEHGAPAALPQQARPTTKLGNLSKFAVIVTDVKEKVAQNDLAGGKARVKDLEVAWDDAEAGLKPRDSARWHQLDDQIDAVLTALRASSPVRGDCASAVDTLLATLNQYDGVS
ncbi:COG4705 family protein [Micromonospora aurantiaca (nom. illeg.)]|uniref:hypothetical protein n=1 Tax=Micromonospora aurantiaca (nom. illeg.) TaxID=47850 RepID=UPI00180901D4